MCAYESTVKCVGVCVCVCMCVYVCVRACGHVCASVCVSVCVSVITIQNHLRADFQKIFWNEKISAHNPYAAPYLDIVWPRAGSCILQKCLNSCKFWHSLRLRHPIFLVQGGEVPYDALM